MDPDTGAVLDSDPLAVGSGAYDGLAALNGKIYVLDYLADDILEFDPATDTVTKVLDVNGINGVGIGGTLAAITGPDALLVVNQSSGTIAAVDPRSGVLTPLFAAPSVGPVYGLAVVAGEIYAGLGGGLSEVRVYSRNGTLARTVTLPYNVSALGGDDVGSPTAVVPHVIELGPDQVVNDLDFGNRLQLGEIHGRKWEDLDGDGVWDAGESALAGWTIYLDLNGNGRLDTFEADLEPDNYAVSTLLNTVLPEVTLSAVGASSPDVYAISPGSSASTGSMTFGHTDAPVWNMSQPWQLRMDFSEAMMTVSIDFISDQPAGSGRLEIYDASDHLLDTYITSDLEHWPVGDDEPLATDARDRLRVGRWERLLRVLGPSFVRRGNRAIGGDGCRGQLFVHRPCSPGLYGFGGDAGRLGADLSGRGGFRGSAVHTSCGGATATIYELDPSDGSLINSFAAPASIANPGPQGLALGPNSLFLLDGSGSGPYTLWELDLDTGDVVDSDPISSPWGIAGLAYLNGRVYLDQDANNTILIWDPLADVSEGSLSVAPDIIGGLTGAADLGLLFGSNYNGEIFAIDPSDGSLVGTPLNPGVGPLHGGLAYLGGELIGAGFASATAFRINPQTGVVLGSFSMAGSGDLSGLAADGITGGVFGASASRLFAVPKDGSGQIVELDPSDGSEVNRFAAPEPPSGGPDG